MSNWNEILNSIDDESLKQKLLVERNELNREAKELRTQRNSLLGHVGLDSSEGYNVDSLTSKLGKLKEADVTSKKQEEQASMSESMKMQTQLDDMQTQFLESERKRKEAETKVVLEKRTASIKDALLENGARKEHIASITALANQSFNGEVEDVSDYSKQFLESNPVFVENKQTKGGDGSSPQKYEKPKESKSEQRKRVLDNFGS